jgi:hypothetical protein
MFVANTPDIRRGRTEDAVYGGACFASGPLDEGSHWANLIMFRLREEEVLKRGGSDNVSLNHTS